MDSGKRVGSIFNSNEGRDSKRNKQDNDSTNKDPECEEVVASISAEGRITLIITIQ